MKDPISKVIAMQLPTTSLAGVFMFCAFAGWLSGCEDSKSVGSGCPDGVCPLVRANDGDACRVSLAQANIAIFTPDEPDAKTLEAVCLGHVLPVIEGLVNARVVYVLPQDATMRCTDLAFLEPAGADLRDAYGRSYPDRELCELRQLVVARDGDGGPAVAVGDGFYFDDFSAEVKVNCRAPHARVTFTHDARPWNGVEVIVFAGDVREPDGTMNGELMCEARSGSVPVGTACLPGKHTVYDPSETVIETRSDACGDGLCMVYHLFGDTGPKCKEDCADKGEVDKRAYCTCRCDAPQGSAELCACPDGFSCVPTIASTDPGIAGSYCVKDGTFTQ